MHHTVLGFCGWDLPAAIILIALIVFFVIRDRKLKKMQKELEDQIDELQGDSIAEQTGVQEPVQQ